VPRSPALQRDYRARLASGVPVLGGSGDDVIGQPDRRSSSAQKRPGSSAGLVARLQPDFFTFSTVVMNALSCAAGKSDAARSKSVIAPHHDIVISVASR
jgi:hypothetical protein